MTQQRLSPKEGSPMRGPTTYIIRISAFVAAFVTLTNGCAPHGPPLPQKYTPVMNLKAHVPQRVTVPPFQITREIDNDAAEWIRNAVVAELEHAGFIVLPEAPPQTSQPIVAGSLKEFEVEMRLDGYRTRIRLNLTVSRQGNLRLDKEYEVSDGGSGITGSANEHRVVITNAVTKLMRRSIPDVISALDR
jgi:hypothetical protein